MKKILFTKDNCVPCKAIKPYLLPLGFEEVDAMAPENEELVLKYEIRSVPTVVITADDKNVVKLTGQAINVRSIQELLTSKSPEDNE